MDLPIFGLKNDNSVCYLNSLLQCLFSSPDLTRNVLDEEDNIEEHKENNKQHITVYYTLISTIIKHPSFTEEPDRLMKVDPKAFKQVFIKSSELFTLGMQEDADEFLVTALDKLHEDIKTSVDLQSDLINIHPERDANLYQHIQNYRHNYSFITRLFHTQTSTKTKCSNCGHDNKRYDMCFQIYLEPPSVRCHLYDCLNKMRVPELLEDYKCDTCKQKNTTTKVVTPSILPCYLTFVLKRFGGRQHVAQVECPLSNLDLTEFMDSQDRQSFIRLNKNKYNKFVYNLYGAVFHVGGMMGGHYYAICRRGNQWYLFNDEQVRPLPGINESYFQRAYMLFYKRV